MNPSFTVDFPGHNLAEANQLAGSLALALSQTDRSVTVERQKADPDTLDAGSILTIVMSSAATLAVAKGVATWLGRNSGALIKIRRSDGTSVQVKHAGEDTADVVRAALS